MKSFKFLRGLALTSLGSVLVFSNVAMAQDLDARQKFSDLDYENGNLAAINYLYKNAVVEGYQDGTFGAEREINRAEFLKILMEVAGIEESGANCYPDVASEWFAPYVCKATDLGIVEGYPDGLFKPGNTINFAEASKIVSNTLELEGVDVDNELWFDEFVTALEKEKAIPNDFTDFGHLLTRGEMSEIVWRVDADIEYKVSNNFENLKANRLEEKIGHELTTFSSCTALEEYFIEDQLRAVGLGGGAKYDDAAAPAVTNTADVAEESTGAARNDDGEYSETNIQVEGVDEADIVKTDGKYIYKVNQATVSIVEAYPAANMAEVARLEFDDDENFVPTQLYVDGDQMVVIGNSYYGGIYPMPLAAEATSLPYNFNGGKVGVYLFDISNPESPSLTRNMNFEGYYTSSRKIDDEVYLVFNTYRSYWDYEEVDSLTPVYFDSADEKVRPVADCDQIKHAPGVQSTSYLSVVGIDISAADTDLDKTTILGASGNVYASRDNLYLAEPGNQYLFFWEDYSNYDERTIVHKFNLDDTLAYQGKGEVPGSILNQFSMDEYQGNFRIATTKGNIWDDANPSTNNVYVLNGNLEQVGEIEGIAPGERIYSTRFAGDRLYMVTFKKVDPFFVIDMDDPSNPEILGQLKIPGYSDYLHVYDDNHVIGFGLDTEEASEVETAARDLDFAWYQGLKMAMFDVTDVTNPTQLHVEFLGDRGSSSPLSYDHKAFLFDKAKGIMAFPATIAELPEGDDQPANAYGDIVFQGAFVYDVSVEDGFQLRAQYTQYDESEVADKAGYYWYGPFDIDRILYIKDLFYTVSQGAVTANDWDDLTEVNRVELELEDGYVDYGEEVLF